MILEDFHLHTTFSDGKNTPEEMIRAALDMGMKRIGISDHAPTPCGESYCIARDRVTEYRETIGALKEKYRGKIDVLCGIEQDLYSYDPAEGYDYVIGSVHAFKHGDAYYDVDYSAERLAEVTEQFYGGDYMTMAEDYFARVAQLAGMRPDIIGHIDLLTKFNEGDKTFSTKNERYLTAAYGAVDALLPCGAAFEINTGAISRKRRTTPYPSVEILHYILSRGGHVIFSSDAHSAENLCYEFETWHGYFRDLGFKI